MLIGYARVSTKILESAEEIYGIVSYRQVRLDHFR